MSVRFGAVQVNQENIQGSAAHLRVTVTEDDRKAFEPNLEHFSAKDRQTAGTDGDAWTFTLGVMPDRKSGIRLIPGHADANNADIFAAFGQYAHSLFGGPRENVESVIRKAVGEVSDPETAEILREWLA